MSQKANNSILSIQPYKDGGLWMFDDERVGLVRELFIAGIPFIIEHMLKVAGIEGGENGFNLIFSAIDFPGSKRLIRVGDAPVGPDEGTWYYSPDTKTKGWLCPALNLYFETSPKALYYKAEAKT